MTTSAKTVLSSPWLPFAVLVVGDLLMVAHALPRTASFAFAAFTVVFVARAPWNAALLFTAASFPFSPALPIPGFDTFALWRLIIAALVLRAFFAFPEVWREKLSRAKLRAGLFFYERLGLALFAIAAASLFVAIDPFTGIRKLIFLINAVAWYALLRWLFAHYASLAIPVYRGLLVGLIGVLLIGAAQYVSVFFVSLFDFWQGWALDTIPVFYGDALGAVLSQSNTWFSYYESGAPTLRMFSLLPDSHSFGLLMLMAFLLALARFMENPKSFSHLVLLAGFALGVYLNGSRGIWLGIAPTLAVALLLALYLKGRVDFHLFSKRLLAGFLLLLALFPVASFIAARAHGTGIDDEKAIVAFKRAKSIFDLEETSNRWRLGIWKANLESVADHPMLGVGFGNSPLALGESVGAARRGASAHNLYLDTAVETGIVGGLLLIAFFLTAVLSTLRHLFRRTAALEKLPLLIAFSLALVWIGFYNLFDVVLFNDRAFLVFLTFLALANKQHKLSQDQKTA